MSGTLQENATHLIRRQTLEATVERACNTCGAPPTYVSHDSIREGWPGCYVTPDDPRLGQLVGTVCPNCGQARRLSDSQPRGVIWTRTDGMPRLVRQFWRIYNMVTRKNRSRQWK